MVRLETIELIREIITNFIAYIPISTLGGYLSAWISKKLGDDSAQESGLLTLNPVPHLDPIGIALIALPPHLGFPRSIPINTYNIKGKFKNLRIILLCFSTFIAYSLVLIFTLFLLSLFNIKLLSGLILTLKELPSILKVILFIFKAVINISIFWMLLYLASGIVSIFVHYLFPDFEENPNYLYLLILLPILIIFLFGAQIEFYLRILSTHIENVFIYLLT